MYQKANPIRDIPGRRAWAKSHPFCQGCGGVTLLTTHHIIRFKRSDEAGNLFRACVFCHGAAENLNVVRDGERLPRLTLANVLWLKRALDPSEWQPDRLTVLYGQALPEPEAPPEYYTYWLRKRKVLLA